LRDSFAAGLESAVVRLGETPAAGTRISLRELSSCTIADLDPERVCGAISPELIAGVSQRLTGRLAGTALFAVDPGDALLWLQREGLQREGAADDPLARFVAWGSCVLVGVGEALASAWQVEIDFGAPVLEERPLMAALLATHAPSDTVVLSLQGELAFDVAGGGEIRAPFGVHVLLQPKVLDAILSALSAPDGDGPLA
jgi:hypothetical protein